MTIGVIGSEDSVAHVLRVADEMGQSRGLITRSYKSPAEAAALATDLEKRCNVILFTGRVPYEFALTQGGLTATAQYVPYGALDLYRTLVHLARQFRGEIPRVSVDTIDRDIVLEVFREVGVASPEYLFPLDDIDPHLSTLTDHMVEFHRTQFQRGNVDVCVTCMSTVREQLKADGIPVTRVRTTDSSVRDSLNRAALTSQLQRSESSQVAVLSITGKPTSIGDADAIGSSLRELASHIDGRLVTNEKSSVVVTTRGSLERELLRNGQLTKALRSLEAVPAWIGVGLGRSLPDAEQNANYAMTVAAATQSHQEVMPDGSIRRLTGFTQSTLRMRNIDAQTHAVTRLGGISPMTLSRLQATLASLGRDDVTARELAQEYGVEPRSARRLLAALHKAGIATPLGAHAAPRAGRPQVVYKIDLELLFAVGSPTPAKTTAATMKGA